MKKMLALVLALVMVLCAVSAMAEGSKTVEDTQQTTVTGGYYGGTPAKEELPTLEIVNNPSDKAQDLINKYKAAHDKNDDLGALSDEAKAEVAKIGSDLTKINEMLAVKFNGNTNVANEVEVILSFVTKYTPGDTVAVLVLELNGDNVKETVLKGTVNDAGDVVVRVPAAMVKGLENNEFLIAVVSK